MNILGSKVAAKPMYFELDIDEPPPVLMLAINPEEFDKTFTKKVSQSRKRVTSRNLGAYLYNFAYDELDTMTCSGTSAMFYGSNGLTTEVRRSTLGFRNLLSLTEIYRNNGRNYFTRPDSLSLVTGGNALIKSVGRVIIAYDDVIYRGSFDSLRIEETDQKPFNFTFNFQFTISKTIDLRNVV